MIDKNVQPQPRFERELRGPIPRKVRLRPMTYVERGGMGCAILFFAPFYFVGIFAFWSAIRATVPLCIGTYVTGIVTDRSIDDSGDSSSNDLTYAYHLGTKEYHATRSVDSSLYYFCHTGSAVRILILPTLPDWPSALAEPGAQGGTYLLWLWVAIWDGCLILLTTMAIKTVRADRQLIAYGTATFGEIKSKETKSDDENKKTYFLYYTFIPASGPGSIPKAVDKSQRVTSAQWESVAEGDTMTVLYIPGKKKIESVIYSFGSYQAVVDN